MAAIGNARRTPGWTHSTLAAPSGPAGAEAKLAEHEAYVVQHLQDLPEVRNWALGDRTARVGGRMTG